MNAIDCSGFRNEGDFLKIIERWKEYSGKATYLIVSSRDFHRLRGSSNILYIGQTTKLGGSNSSRLWYYNYPNHDSKEYDINGYIKNLISKGNNVSLYLCQVPPAGRTVREYEKYLLQEYRNRHWELPPWNSQS